MKIGVFLLSYSNQYLFFNELKWYRITLTIVNYFQDDTL